jgi:hypothetical protein
VSQNHLDPIASRKLGLVTRLTAGQELRKLPHLLEEGEAVLGLARGACEGSPGLVAATDHRLLFVAAQTAWEVPYELISHVDARVGLTAGTITIVASRARTVIEHVIPSETAPATSDIVRAYLSGRRANAVPFVKLRRLRELRDAGLVNQEEFDVWRTSLLEKV